MSKLPDFIKADIDEIEVWMVDLPAMRHKLNTSTWTEEDGPVEVSDAELVALLGDAVARGIDEGDARFLGYMLAESPAEQIPGLRLAYAHLLATSHSSSINNVCNALGHAIRQGDSNKYKMGLASRFDWTAIAKQNAERRREKEQRKAEEAKRRHHAEVEEEAQRCWINRLPPLSDEVRDEMIAHQQRWRERLRRWDDDDGERHYRSEDEIRLKMARDGYGYDDGDFFLADRYRAIAEILQRQKDAEIQAMLDDPAFAEDEGDGPILEYFDPETGLLPSYPNGGILEVIGPAQNFKTTMVVRLLCAALAHDRKRKVLYLAGELPAHVRALRDAYGAEEGLTAGDIRSRFHVHNGMPAMGEPENAERVLNMVETLGADIVVADTWARAIAGLREISDAPGNLLAEAGAIGRIVARGVLVILIGHCPLNGEKRLRGNSSADNAGDARVWVIGGANGFKVEVLKMRPVPPGHMIYATVPPVPRNLSPAERAMLPPPVITWCTKAEYDKAVHDPRQRAKEPPASEPVKWVFDT